MLGVNDVLHADLGKLATAAESWRKFASGLREITTQFDGDVSMELGNSWGGQVANEQVQTELRLTHEDFAAAVVEADAVATYLDTAAVDLVTAQQRLRAAIDAVAAAGMTWQQDSVGGHFADIPGGVQVTWPALSSSAQMNDAAFSEFQRDRESTAKRLADDISAALNTAREADTALSDALRRAIGGVDERFNANPQADPYSDVDRAMALLNKQSNLSDAERKELFDLLRRNEKNDLFAEEVMLRVGPEKVIALSQEYANDYSAENTLGTLLSSASPRLAQDPAWMLRLEDAGREMHKAGAGYEYGYQPLSLLFRNGGYDPKFLSVVGDDIMDMEKANGGGQLWNSVNGQTDPMNNLLVGLSKSPEAATAFFSPRTQDLYGDPLAKPETKADAQARLDYLLKARNIVGPGNPAYGADEMRPHLDALGEALVAATTGEGRPRTREMMDVLSNAVGAMGGTVPPYVPDVMKDSVSEMLAKNIASVHYGISRPGLPENPLYSNNEPIAGFHTGELTRVISTLGDSPEHMGNLYKAESAFMVSGLDAITAHGGMPQTQPDFVSSASQVFGVLDKSTTDAMRSAQQEHDETINSTVDTAKSWGESLGSKLVEGIPWVGPAASEYVVAPVLDELFSRAQVDTTDATTLQISGTYDTTRESVLALADEWRNSRQPSMPSFDASVANGLNDGHDHYESYVKGK
ncbi:hypothetical protein [Yinghuangia seranimata]|uniref:hypothetical protein n=1 Tax=Yinghuangia seranimata TaxID=408067 RepID=UPI00248BEF06|nr:hypothetical protein [Yinghuangia seranimata]MDI2132479.1 hypothetical protein [Yinghuangia seranimata]